MMINPDGTIVYADKYVVLTKQDVYEAQDIQFRNLISMYPDWSIGQIRDFVDRTWYPKKSEIN